MANTDEKKTIYESGMLRRWLNICHRFPSLSDLNPPVLCATVYYPIALLEMEMQEYSFEDFDAIELTLLRFCAAGINRPEELCRWMGLTSLRYVTKRLGLLTAEGLMQNGQLTELGEESLQDGRKIQFYDTKQIFQADGIFGLLLPKEYQKRTEALKDRKETRSYPHLMRSDSIAEETILDAIKGYDKIQNYKRYRKSILNVNVDKVLSIEFSELKYLPVLLTQFESESCPIVFFPRRVHNQKTGKTLYTDDPLYLSQQMADWLPEMADNCEIVQDSQFGILMEMCDMIQEDLNEVNDQDVQNWMENNTAFRVPNCFWEEDGRLCVELDVKEGDVSFTPLDLELMAAAAQPDWCPVELFVALPRGNGNMYKRYITVWPKPGSLPPEAEYLAAHWSDRSHIWLKEKKNHSWEDIKNLLQSDGGVSDENDQNLATI